MLNHLQKTCPVCKKQFFVKPSHFEKRVTCSKACYAVFQKTQMLGSGNPHFKNAKTTKKCETCGKEFSYWASMRKNATFCSQSCAAKSRTGDKNSYWRGGYGKYYGQNWIPQSEKARQRDSYTCQKCGVTEQETGRKLDVHHIKQFTLCADYQEANHIDNLISLCRKCHRIAEIESRSVHGVPDYKKKPLSKVGYLLSPTEAAKVIGLTVWAVYAAIRRGQIKAQNICEGIASRERPRFLIHADDAKSYKKRYK